MKLFDHLNAALPQERPDGRRPLRLRQRQRASCRSGPTRTAGRSTTARSRSSSPSSGRPATQEYIIRRPGAQRAGHRRRRQGQDVPRLGRPRLQAGPGATAVPDCCRAARAGGGATGPSPTLAARAPRPSRLVAREHRLRHVDARGRRPAHAVPDPLRQPGRRHAPRRGHPDSRTATRGRGQPDDHRTGRDDVRDRRPRPPGPTRSSARSTRSRDDRHPDGQVGRRCSRHSPAGTPIRRRRALFGLLDADGWAWAGGQGGDLVRPDHPAARLHPRPGLLLHGQPDDRRRPPGLVAGQLLPGREQDPALSRPRSARSIPWEAVAGRALAARRRGPTARSPSSGRGSSYVGGIGRDRADRPRPTSPSSRAARSGPGPTGPALPEARAGAVDRGHRQLGLPHRRRRCRRRAPRTPSGPSPSTPDTAALGAWAPVEGVTLPEAARRRLGARRLRRPRRRRRPRTGRDARRDGLEGERRHEGRPRRARGPGRAAAGGGRRHDRARSATSSGSTAGSTPTGPVGAVQRGNLDVEPTPETPAPNATPAPLKVLRWDVNDAANLPAAADGRRRLRRQRHALRGRRRRRHRPADRGLLDRPERRRLAARLEAPRRDGPAGAASRAPRRSSPARTSLVIGGSTADGTLASSVRANLAPAGAVLPARPRRRRRPGPQDRRRDRPAARLPRRGRRRAP